MHCQLDLHATRPLHCNQQVAAKLPKCHARHRWLAHIYQHACEENSLA